MSWNFMEPASRGNVEAAWRPEPDAMPEVASDRRAAGLTQAGRRELLDRVRNLFLRV